MSSSCADLHRLSCLRNGVRPSPFGVDIPRRGTVSRPQYRPYFVCHFYRDYHIMKLYRFSFVFNNIRCSAIGSYFTFLYALEVPQLIAIEHTPSPLCHVTPLFLYNSVVSTPQLHYCHVRVLLLYNSVVSIPHRGGAWGYVAPLQHYTDTVVSIQH